MFSSSRSTSAAESVEVGEIRRSLCGTGEVQTAVGAVVEEEVSAEHVVLTASSVGSGKLQAAASATAE